MAQTRSRSKGTEAGTGGGSRDTAWYEVALVPASNLHMIAETRAGPCFGGNGHPCGGTRPWGPAHVGRSVARASCTQHPQRARP